MTFGRKGGRPKQPDKTIFPKKNELVLCSWCYEKWLKAGAVARYTDCVPLGKCMGCGLVGFPYVAAKRNGSPALAKLTKQIEEQVAEKRALLRKLEARRP